MNLNIRKTIILFSLLAMLIPIPCLGLLEEDEEVIKSFMPGVIRRIAVVPGQQIKRGDLLYIFEVMKMECSVNSPRAGFIGSLYFTVDQLIEKDIPLISILSFMPVEKGGDPMDVDELPLPVFEITAPLTEVINNEEGISNLSSPESMIIAIEQFTSETELIPEIFDSEENDSDVPSSKIVMTLPVEQSVFENELQTTQHDEMPFLLAIPITETFDNEGEGADISLSAVESQSSQQEDRLQLLTAPIIEIPKSKEGIFEVLPSAMITFMEQSVFESEPQTSHQEQMLPLVAAPITEIFDNEGDGADISLSRFELQASQQEETLSLIIASMKEVLNDEVEGELVASLPSVIASEAKPSISEHQAPQQVSTPSWIAAASTSPINDEAEGEAVISLPFAINEAKPSISEHQVSQQVSTPSWIAAASTSPINDEAEGEVVAFLPSAINEAKPSVLEHQVPQQVSTPSWIAAASTSPINDGVEGELVASLSPVIASEAEPSIFEVTPQTPQQEVILPLVVAPITIPLSVSDISDVSSPVGVIEGEANQSIPEYQLPQQQLYLFNMKTPYVHASSMSSPRKQGSSHSLDSRFRGNDNLYDLNSSMRGISTSFWITALSSRPDLPFSLSEPKAFNDDETGVSSSLQKVKEEELRQELNNPMTSIHLPWLTGLLLLGLLFFCRTKPIMSYRVKNILTHKGAVNLNIPGYIRDVA